MPSDNDTFAMFSKLSHSEMYIRIPELEEGSLYYINARNAHLGIWCAKEQGFIISRHKLERNYLFIEYHWDTGVPYGTVKPFLKIEKVPLYEKLSTAMKSGSLDTLDKELKSSLLKYLNNKDEEIPFNWEKIDGLY